MLGDVLFWGAQALAALACTLLLVRLALPDAAPAPLLASALRALGGTRDGRRGLLALGAFALLGLLENAVDPHFTRLAVSLHGVEDFAVWIHGLEGGATARLQAFAPAPLVWFFLLVYVALLPATCALVGLAGHHLGRRDLLVAGAKALLLNWLLALPFFLFVSVRETWYADLGPHADKARLLLTGLPWDLEPRFRLARGIENNFPSLHTSLSATAALLLWRTGAPRARAVGAVSAALVAFSTLYLGFHWLADMAAGLLLAWTAVTIATRGALADEPEADAGSGPS